MTSKLTELEHKLEELERTVEELLKSIQILEDVCIDFDRPSYIN